MLYKQQQMLNMIKISEGIVLKTNHNIKAFKLYGNQYTTNSKRKGRYSFDDKSWKETSYSVYWKIWMVVTNKAKKL